LKTGEGLQPHQPPSSPLSTPLKVGSGAWEKNMEDPSIVLPFPGIEVDTKDLERLLHVSRTQTRHTLKTYPRKHHLVIVYLLNISDIIIAVMTVMVVMTSFIRSSL